MTVHNILRNGRETDVAGMVVTAGAELVRRANERIYHGDRKKTDGAAIHDGGQK